MGTKILRDVSGVDNSYDGEFLGGYFAQTIEINMTGFF